MNKPRKIGPLVLQAVEALEEQGECTFSAGRPRKHSVRTAHRPSRALIKAVEYGLVERSPDKPYVYRPAPDWREYLQPAAVMLPIGRVSSVWDLARS